MAAGGARILTVIRPRFRDAPDPPVRVVFACDLAGREPAPVEWIVPGLFPRKHVTMLAGPPTVGKSFLALMLMVASWSRAATWFGLPIEPIVRSYAIFSEDSEDAVHGRFKRIAEEYAVDPAVDLDEGRVAWTAEPNDGTAFDPTLYRCDAGRSPRLDVDQPEHRQPVLSCLQAAARRQRNPGVAGEGRVAGHPEVHAQGRRSEEARPGRLDKVVQAALYRDLREIGHGMHRVAQFAEQAQSVEAQRRIVGVDGDVEEEGVDRRA